MRNSLGNTWWIVIGIQAVLVVLVFLFLIPYITDRTLAEQLGDPVWIQRNRNAARQLIPHLQVTLQLAAVGTVLIPVFCTAIWFLYLWFKYVEAPGEARRAAGHLLQRNDKVLTPRHCHRLQVLSSKQNRVGG